jgi:replicative DNA helicase
MHTNGYANGTAQQARQEVLSPHSEKAERAIIGGIIIDNAALFDVMDALTSDDFYLATHKRIFGAMVALHRNGAAIDAMTLGEVIKDDTVTSRLYDYVIDAADAFNLTDYARIVKAHSTRRRLTSAAGNIATLAADTSAGVDKLVAQAEQEIFAITQEAAPARIESARVGMSRIFDLVQERQASGEDFIGLRTGFADVDKIIEGMKPGNLHIFAGRPGMGKSLFEDHVATYNAMRGKRVIRFNLEMTSEQIWLRSMAGVTGLPFTKMINGKLSAGEFDIYARNAGELSEMGMWVDDTPSITLTQLSSRCRRLNAEHGIDLITIDYLQLMGVDGTHQNRNQEIGSISRGLKRLAKDLRVPVLCLAQLNRNVGQRQDKRPLLSDLRDSGEIEQDADVVMMIYRDEYYDELTETPNEVEVNVVKNRHGPQGGANLYFDSKAPRLCNLKKDSVNF